MFIVSSAGIVPILSFLILYFGPACWSLWNVVLMEGKIKHCAQRWEGIWPWWKGMQHVSLTMWLLSIDFRLMGISIKRLPPEFAPCCDYMWKMSDSSSSFTDIVQMLPPVLVSDALKTIMEPSIMVRLLGPQHYLCITRKNLVTFQTLIPGTKLRTTSLD